MSLSPTQTRAVTSQSPAINLVAGPGSGKTHTVVQRIKHLHEVRGVPTQAILCITFTRKAANELKSRLEREIGPAARRIWASTFHGIGYAMLSQWGREMGYDVGENKITIVTPEESDELIRQAVKMYDYKGGKTAITSARSALAHREQFPDDMDISRIIKQYWEWLKESNAIDFDMILLEVNRLFRKCDRAREHYHNKFRYVFVDEYQDTDRTQYNLHDLINPENIFVVGDSDQSIFSWRGADLGIILGFEKKHPSAETILLEDCFRCRTSIVDAANSLIEKNKNRIKKTIRAVHPGGEVQLIHGGPLEIANLLSENEDWCLGDPSEIAVIARTHGELANIEAACQSKLLKVFRVGAQSDAVQSRTEWKIFHAVLRMAVNRRDGIAFRVWGRQWLGVGDHDLLDLNKVSAKTGVSMVQAWEIANGSEALDMILEQKTAIDALEVFCGGGRDGATNAIAEYLAENGGDRMSPQEWLTWSSLKDGHSELEKRRPKAITLLTAHAAKGLEWDNVIVAGFSENEFPKKRSVKEGGIEEERRLAYVAFTRARHRLAIFYSKKPSQFCEEAGLCRSA